jgi:hypothetical protein
MRCTLDCCLPREKTLELSWRAYFFRPESPHEYAWLGERTTIPLLDRDVRISDWERRHRIGQVAEKKEGSGCVTGQWEEEEAGHMAGRRCGFRARAWPVAH